jgi:RPA family protein
MIREAAWRIFAAEFNDAQKSLSDGGERSPNYVLTPLGAKVNRLLLAGVLTDIENLGTDQEPMWRARVSDPTGTFHVYAGQYQPAAAAALGKVKPPAFVAIVGKGRTYTTDQGAVYTSVRPEWVRESSAAFRDLWVLEAAKFLRRRLDLLGKAYALDESSMAAVKGLGCSDAWADGIVNAIDEYGKVDLSRYMAMLAEGLRYLLPEFRDEAPVEPEEDQPSKETEDRVLELIGTLDADGKGAPWDQLVSGAADSGIEREGLEATIDLLLDRGTIYEPVLGRIRRI